MIGGKRLQGDSGRVGVRVEKYNPPHPSLPPPGGKELWSVLEQKIFVIRSLANSLTSTIGRNLKAYRQEIPHVRSE